jgi:predicted mannosyl-3-phosphoglycerate phosphatase (HAD superfamily)
MLDLDSSLLKSGHELFSAEPTAQEIKEDNVGLHPIQVNR